MSQILRYFIEIEQQKFLERIGGEEGLKKLLEEEQWKMEHPKTEKEKLRELNEVIKQLEAEKK